jgi:hypothetical protein
MCAFWSSVRDGSVAQAAGVVSSAIAEMAYFALVLAALPFALLESTLGYGATLWVHARSAQ